MKLKKYRTTVLFRDFILVIYTLILLQCLHYNDNYHHDSEHFLLDHKIGGGLLSAGGLLPGLLVELVEAGADALPPPAVRAGGPHCQITGRTRSATEVFVAPRLGALQEELLTGLTERDEVLVFVVSLSLTHLTPLLSLLPVLPRLAGLRGEIFVQDSTPPQAGHPAAGAG